MAYRANQQAFAVHDTTLKPSEQTDHATPLPLDELNASLASAPASPTRRSIRWYSCRNCRLKWRKSVAAWPQRRTAAEPWSMYETCSTAAGCSTPQPACGVPGRSAPSAKKAAISTTEPLATLTMFGTSAGLTAGRQPASQRPVPVLCAGHYHHGRQRARMHAHHRPTPVTLSRPLPPIRSQGSPGKRRRRGHRLSNPSTTTCWGLLGALLSAVTDQRLVCFEAVRQSLCDAYRGACHDAADYADQASVASL